MSYVDTFGPVADNAATKYGIDPAIFRNLIASESSWNPYAINPQSVNGENATGIAQFLPSTASSMGVDPLNPYSALEGAAKYIADLSAKYGLDVAIAKYKGYSNPTSDAAKTAVSKITGIYPSGTDPSGNQMGPDAIQQGAVDAEKTATGTDKALWRWDLNDWKSFIQSGAWGLVFGFVGLLIIVFSIYMLTKRGGTDSVAVVKNVTGH